MAKPSLQQSPVLSEKLIYSEIVLSTFLLSGNFIFAKIALARLDPIFLASSRFLLAATIMALVLSISGKIKKISSKSAVELCILGLIGIAVYHIVFFIGLEKSMATHALAIIAATPAWVAIIGSMALGEKITRNKIIGFCFAFTGILFIIFDKTSLQEFFQLSGPIILGDLFLVISSILWAIYCVGIKKTSSKYGSTTVTVYSQIFGALFLIALTIITVPINQQIEAMIEIDWYCIAYMSLIGTAIGFFLWNDGLKNLGASRGIVFLNLVPVWGAILSVIFLSEVLTLNVLIAMALVIAGVIKVQK